MAPPAGRRRGLDGGALLRDLVRLASMLGLLLVDQRSIDVDQRLDVVAHRMCGPNAFLELIPERGCLNRPPDGVRKAARVARLEMEAVDAVLHLLRHAADV